MFIRTDVLFLFAGFTLTTAFRTYFIFDNVTDKTKSDETDNEDSFFTVEENGTSVTVTDSVTQPTPSPIVEMMKLMSDHLMKVTDELPKEVNNIEKAIEVLNSTVQQINKTVQVMRLTAQYINISASFLLNTLNDYINKVNETKEIQTKRISDMYKDTMSMIQKHINSTLEDLKLKSLVRPTTGEDLLTTISYHLVSAFQDMTNLAVSSLPVDKAYKVDEAVHKADKFVQTEDTKKPISKIEIFSVQEDYIGNERDVKNNITKNGNLFAKTLLRIPIPLHLGPSNLKDILATQNNGSTKGYFFDLNFCGNAIRPICGVDIKMKKYIIFLNDCKRIVYNQLHNTRYIPFTMDICMGLFLRNSNVATHFVPAKQ